MPAAQVLRGCLTATADTLSGKCVPADHIVCVCVSAQVLGMQLEYQGTQLLVAAKAAVDPAIMMQRQAKLLTTAPLPPLTTKNAGDCSAGAAAASASMSGA